MSLDLIWEGGSVGQRIYHMKSKLQGELSDGNTIRSTFIHGIRPLVFQNLFIRLKISDVLFFKALLAKITSATNFQGILALGGLDLV
jgi:hypothetical protein